MAMAEENRVGINIFGNKLRVVEAQKVNGTVNVVNVAESVLDIPLDFYAIGNQELIPQFATAIKRLLERHGVKAQRAHYALERRMVILKKMSVDRTLSDEEVRQHVEWELEQLLISSREEYNVGVDILEEMLPDYRNVIVVAVRKAIIYYLQEIFKQAPLNLSFIEVDIFSAIRGLYGSKKEKPVGLSALIDINDRGIDFTLIENDHYALSSEMPVFQSSGKSLSYLNGSAGEIATVLNDELVRLIDSLNYPVMDNKITAIYLTGDRAETAVIPALQSLMGPTKIAFANPFQAVQQQVGLDSGALAEKESQKFLVSVGLTLME
jgi:Tfp pilus assembly PilM family ATPase